MLLLRRFNLFFFFFNDTATTEIYTLSLHDALPILEDHGECFKRSLRELIRREFDSLDPKVGDNENQTLSESTLGDRKSTRLNSSHQIISYAVFCLKKKKNEI